MEIKFYEVGHIENNSIKYAVICSIYKGQLVLVRHKDRTTWEIPGGHREPDENVNDTASRELFEETGAKLFKISSICDYEVIQKESSGLGRLFYADVEELGRLPESEIAEVRLFNNLPDNLTYPDIQPLLYSRVMQFIAEKTN